MKNSSDDSISVKYFIAAWMTVFAINIISWAARLDRDAARDVILMMVKDNRYE